MYPNLRAEMARKGVSVSQMAVAMGVGLQTLSRKLNGGSEFTLKECITIKHYLGLDMSIDTLFYKKGAS